MTRFEISGATHEDCVLAVAVAGKSSVVHCFNPANAASPVMLLAGGHLRSLGQSADYRHNLSGLPAVYKAALVTTWWDQEDRRWRTNVEIAAGSEQAIRDFVSRRQAEREAADKIARNAEAKLERENHERAVARSVETAIKAVLAIAQEMAPGRVTAKQATDGTIIVGRWADDLIPGYGRPSEVMTPRWDGGKIVLVPASASYAYAW